MRIMALDYGDARTGVAISDLNGILCGETLVLNEWDAERLAQRVSALARERGCGLILLGLPLNMDGSEGPRAEKARQFAALLRALDVPEVLLRDERRTSVEAHAILRAKSATARTWTPWRRSSYSRPSSARPKTRSSSEATEENTIKKSGLRVLFAPEAGFSMSVRHSWPIVHMYE